MTPAADLVLSFPTWTDFAEDCGNSRVWAGVHFTASVPAGQKIGTRIGNLAYKSVTAHIEGTAKPRRHLRRNHRPS
ncbi:hypothetical protein BH23ACT10_BH23ACT10_23050 [soil metagenome]